MTTAKSQGYAEYRTTDILWAPLAPEHWQTIRMDALATMNRDHVTPVDMHDRSVVHYSIPNVQDTGGALLEDGSSISSNKFKVEADDVLYSKLNPRKETIAIVRAHEGLVVASSEFVVLRPFEQDQNYLQYLLHVPGFKAFACAQVESATRSHQRINPSLVSKLILASPPPEERNQIAKFLDYETAKIDALIEKQQRLIALLEAKRQSVIAHAVTKGRKRPFWAVLSC